MTFIKVGSSVYRSSDTTAEAESYPFKRTNLEVLNHVNPFF